MNYSIEEILDKIYSSLNQHKDYILRPITIKKDILLFNILYLKHRNKVDQLEEFSNDLQFLIEEAIEMKEVSLITGITGVRFFLVYLYENDLIDEEDIGLICNDDTLLANISMKMLIDDNYDFLHGSLGIAYYLLKKEEYSKNYFFVEYFKAFNALKQKSVSGKAIPNYDLIQRVSKLDEVNLGMAHGIVSVIKFCIQCYKQKICPLESRQLCEELIEYLISHQNKDTSKSFFSYCIKGNETSNSYSRLAWCYGDLSLAYILYDAGKTLNNMGVCDFALKVLMQCSKMRDLQEAQVRDAGFCHGSAGIAHIFNKMWHHTGNKTFKETCDYWIDKTVSFCSYQDGIGGYKSYNALLAVYEGNYSMLEGTSGIGMVLYSYLTGDFSWDYCLMLN